MRGRVLLGLIAAVLLCTQPLQAKTKDKAKEETKQAVKPLAQVDKAKQEKEALITNITVLRNQELRVAILQQLLNEELAKLRDVQTAFCNKYKLDIEKLRKDLYRYDEKENKFIEVKSEK